MNLKVKEKAFYPFIKIHLTIFYFELISKIRIHVYSIFEISISSSYITKTPMEIPVRYQSTR